MTLWEYAIKTRCPDGNWALEAERWTNETEFVYAFTKRCKSAADPTAYRAMFRHPKDAEWLELRRTTLNTYAELCGAEGSA